MARPMPGSEAHRAEVSGAGKRGTAYTVQQGRRSVFEHVALGEHRRVDVERNRAHEAHGQDLR